MSDNVLAAVIIFGPMLVYCALLCAALQWYQSKDRG
jgi:hypothetical protein